MISTFDIATVGMWAIGPIGAGIGVGVTIWAKRKVALARQTAQEIVANALFREEAMRLRLQEVRNQLRVAKWLTKSAREETGYLRYLMNEARAEAMNLRASLARRADPQKQSRAVVPNLTPEQRSARTAKGNRTRAENRRRQEEMLRQAVTADLRRIVDRKREDAA